MVTFLSQHLFHLVPFCFVSIILHSTIDATIFLTSISNPRISITSSSVCCSCQTGTGDVVVLNSISSGNAVVPVGKVTAEKVLVVAVLVIEVLVAAVIVGAELVTQIKNYEQQQQYKFLRRQYLCDGTTISSNCSSQHQAQRVTDGNQTKAETPKVTRDLKKHYK